MKAALVGAAALATAPAAVAGKAEVPGADAIRRVAQAVEKNDCKGVVASGRPLLDGKVKTLPAEIVPPLYEVVVGCEIDLDAKDQAYAHALAATKLDQISDLIWRLRLAIELETKRYEPAVATVEAMSQGRGAALNSVEVSWLWQLDRGLKDAGSTALRRRLLKVLASDSYLPDAYYGPPDTFRLAYANLLADAGETEAARGMVASLQTAQALSEAGLDNRLRAYVPAGRDIRAAAEADLAGHREAAARHPDKLAPIVYAAADLRVLGRPKEGLELLQGVAPRVEDEKAFTDRDDQLNWYWDAVARTQATLGRYDEAVAAFRKADPAGESGTLNVSQVINLAEHQNRFGHGADALKTLAVFADPKREVSPYGASEMRFARACAYSLSGRPGEAAADLAYLKAHEKDHGEALSDALLCLGDMDGAAAAFIRRLDDPDRRAAALLQLSDYDTPPVPLPADPVRSRLPALKARPDVKAAIDKAGGIRRFPLQQGEI